MLDQLLQIGGYVVGTLLFFFAAWRVFTLKTVPQKWAEWNLWPHARPKTALELAAMPARGRTRWFEFAQIVVALALFGILVVRELSEPTIPTSESPTAPTTTAFSEPVETAVVPAGSELQASNEAKDREITVLRNSNAVLTALLERQMGTDAARVAIAAESAAVPLGPATLATVTGVSAATYADTVERQRTALGLRALSERAELGRSVSLMPPGAFGFTYPGYFNGPSFALALGNAPSMQEREDLYELRRRTSGELYIVVFVDEPFLPTITTLDGINERIIDTFGRPTPERHVMVEIPTDRIVRASERTAGSRPAVEFIVR